jgi:hypothetical protein
MTPYRTQGQGPREKAAYKDFDATSLYCPRCRQAGPVRKRLLLVLPQGDEYEYLCARCGTSVGMKIDSDGQSNRVIY